MRLRLWTKRPTPALLPVPTTDPLDPAGNQAAVSAAVFIAAQQVDPPAPTMIQLEILDGSALVCDRCLRAYYRSPGASDETLRIRALERGWRITPDEDTCHPCAVNADREAQRTLEREG